MRSLLLTWVTLVCANTVFAQSVIFLDEGINTQQRWDVPNAFRGSQGCRSIPTNFDDAPGNSVLLYGSLCTDPTLPIDQGTDVAIYANKKRYTQPSNTSGTNFVDVTLKRTIQNVEHGEHGNWVSNAIYDFDTTLVHRPWVIFGIDRETQSFDSWVTAFRPVGFPNEHEEPGASIFDTLDYIAFLSGDPNTSGSELKDLGAVNLSLTAPPGNLSDLRCGRGDGQVAVNALYARGIAVVVALDNDDAPSNKKTWPACLDKVIKVGGERASIYTGTRQIGIGDNGDIDFFAKDTTNDGQEGNSFAAPRIAAAYAKLHELFPFSTVSEKTNALEAANTRMDTYRTRLVDNSFVTFTARKVYKSDMPAAIAYLEILYPPPDEASSNINIVDGSSYGPFFGAPRADYRSTINFRQLQPNPKLPVNQAVFKAGTGVLSSRRDVELKFTGVIDQATSSDGFKLIVNGTLITNIQSFPFTGESQKTYIINRNFFTDAGDNTIILEPNIAASNWGVRDVAIEFLPIVELALGVTDTNEYGFERTPSRYTGLRASFELTSSSLSALSLTVTGWDIDRSDETEVFINGTLLGNLTAAASSSIYSPPDSFMLDPAILRTGTNYIEFVQREPLVGEWFGTQDVKWAVKDIRVEAVSSDLAATNLAILDNSISPNVPFTAIGVVTNAGTGTSPESTVKFYLSDTPVITTLDTEIGSSILVPILPNGSENVSLVLQTDLVNAGYYLGMCVTPVAGEINVNNNCSNAIELGREVTLMPILMLILLDDELPLP